jgi:phosphohistidine phosphatase SixA
MSILVIRHGLSEANNRHNAGSLAFASGEAPLMALGREQAHQLGEKLAAHYGIDVASQQVATSTLRRTQETAHEAGFTAITAYASLDEVKHGMELPDLRTALYKRHLPYAALVAVETILNDPPPEQVWITHGLVIAGLCEVLNVAQGERFIPKFCEVRELPV